MSVMGSFLAIFGKKEESPEETAVKEILAKASNTIRDYRSGRGDIFSPRIEAARNIVQVLYNGKPIAEFQVIIDEKGVMVFMLDSKNQSLFSYETSLENVKAGSNALNDIGERITVALRLLENRIPRQIKEVVRGKG